MARLLGATGRVEVVGQAGDASEALAALAHVTADVVFLDIHMPGMSGLELATRLPAGPCVVFTTAYDQHALEAFETSAVDYLLKPVERPRLARALDRVERLRADPSRGDLTAMLERLAATRPQTLATMHGSSWRGDGAALLRALAAALAAGG